MKGGKGLSKRNPACESAFVWMHGSGTHLAMDCLRLTVNLLIHTLLKAGDETSEAKVAC